MADTPVPAPAPAPAAAASGSRRGRVPHGARWLLGGLVAALLAVWLFSPWWTLARMQRALAARDADTLSTYVDYPAVRESLKPVIAARVKGELLQQMGRFGGAAAGAGLGSLVEQVTGAATAAAVDTAVTPAGLMALLMGAQLRDAAGTAASPAAVGTVAGPATATPPTPPGSDARQPLRFHGGYDDPSHFRVVLQPPNGGEIHFVMRRQGFARWRLVEIVPPA